MRTYERKLITVGNSVGVTFPPEVLDALGLKAGDWLELKVGNEEDGDDQLESGAVSEIIIAKSDVRERTHAHQNEVSRHRRTLETRSAQARSAQARARVKK